jgi:hypothetical protein
MQKSRTLDILKWFYSNPLGRTLQGPTFFMNSDPVVRMAEYPDWLASPCYIYIVSQLSQSVTDRRMEGGLEQRTRGKR